MAGVDGRFWRWCGVLAIALAVFGGYLVALDALDVRGWLHVVAVIAFAIPLRIFIQAFLREGRGD